MYIPLSFGNCSTIYPSKLFPKWFLNKFDKNALSKLFKYESWSSFINCSSEYYSAKYSFNDSSSIEPFPNDFSQASIQLPPQLHKTTSPSESFHFNPLSY